MISPLLWQSVSHGDETAWLDFMGQHEQTHRVLAATSRTLIRTLDDMLKDLTPHGALHDALADRYGIGRVGDWTSYDLREPEAFYSFMALHAQDHVRIARAAGVI